MAPGLLAGLFRYGESELDPAVQAEILLESARNEARVAFLEIILAIGFGWFWLGLGSEPFRAIAAFTLVTVLSLLFDATLRRSAAKRLVGMGPRPPPRNPPGAPPPAPKR